MTYNNMSGILLYLRSKKLNISKELNDFLINIEQVTPEEYPILQHDIRIIKKYFTAKFKNADIRDFLIRNLNKLSTEDLIFCLNLLFDKLKPKEGVKILISACEDSTIRNDIYAISMLASQDTLEKMQVIMSACEIPQILADKEALSLIIKQDTHQKQRAVLQACRVPEIRANKFALGLIASQDTASKMRQMGLAFANPLLRENNEAIDDISSQETWEAMEAKRVYYEEKLALEAAKEELNRALQKVDMDAFIESVVEYKAQPSINDNLLNKDIDFAKRPRH